MFSFWLKDSADGKLAAGTVYTQKNEEAIRDFSSPTWQKTAIAVAAEFNADITEHNKDSARISSKSKEVGTWRVQNSNMDLIQEIMR